MKFLFYVALVVLIAPHAHASMVTATCYLSSNISAVSPLNENLNYSQGSGMAADIVVATGPNASSRVGNLNFSTGAGDRVTELPRNDQTGERIISFEKMNSSIVFTLRIDSKMTAPNKYGSAPMSQSSASLSYQTNKASQSIKLASFFCD